jgi:hypothetical protein
MATGRKLAEDHGHRCFLPRKLEVGHENDNEGHAVDWDGSELGRSREWPDLKQSERKWQSYPSPRRDQ